jgi:hypothetical protein
VAAQKEKIPWLLCSSCHLSTPQMRRSYHFITDGILGPIVADEAVEGSQLADLASVHTLESLVDGQKGS